MTHQPNHPLHSSKHQFDCFATAARVLDRAVSKIYDDALRPLGLRSPQMTLLVVISRMPGVTAAELADFLVIDRSTLSRNLVRLIESGWVREEESASDARARPLNLTRDGLRVLKKAQPAWENAQAEAQQVLGKEASQRMLQSAIGLMTPPSVPKSSRTTT